MTNYEYTNESHQISVVISSQTSPTQAGWVGNAPHQSQRSQRLQTSCEKHENQNSEKNL